MNRTITISKEELDGVDGIETYNALRSTERNLRIKTPSLAYDCNKKGSYHYIPIGTSFIIKRFIAIRKWIKIQDEYPIKTENNKFLDAGSGIGNVLLLAKAVGLAKHFTGIEFNEPTHKMAKKLVNNREGNFKLILDNILTYNKYNNFDILYYYCPLNNRRLEVYFEELIEDAASIGTIIIPMMKLGKQISNDSRIKKIKLEVECYGYDDDLLITFYVKVKNGKRKRSCLQSIKLSKNDRIYSEGIIADLQKDRAEIY